jgi:hypothetical protein
MTYLHEGRISEAQHVSTPNGSSSGADSSLSAELVRNMYPYCRVVLCFYIQLITRSSKLIFFNGFSSPFRAQASYSVP